MIKEPIRVGSKYVESKKKWKKLWKCMPIKKQFGLVCRDTKLNEHLSRFYKGKKGC